MFFFQAQVAHIGASLHVRTPYPLRVPSPAMPVFWAVNAVLLLIMPQVLAYRCVQYPEFFTPVSQKETRAKKSK